VTEHEGRLICAACHQKIARGSTRADRRRGIARTALRVCLAPFVAVLAWCFFYAFGQMLLAMFGASAS
jgi:hypothetical protein